MDNISHCADIERSWYESRSNGSRFKDQPLQSLLSASMLLNTKRQTMSLENELLQLINKRQKKARLSIVSDRGRKILLNKYLPKQQHQSEWSQQSLLSQSLDLADEILLVGEHLSKQNAINNQKLANINPQMNCNPNFQPRSNNLAIESQRNVIHQASNNSHNYSDNDNNNHNHSNKNFNNTANVDNKAMLSGPFKTAKQQFTSEGGTFKKSHQQNDNGFSKARTNSNQSKPDRSDGNSQEKELPEELQGFDKALVEKIEADILHRGQAVTFDDISGLSFAKKCVTELICWPMARPDIFQGLRSLPRGVLLFGPPGTGKTLIGKAIAHQSGATFFSISASSLMSKWIGEGEKTVRTLFAVAAYRQPSVVFLDEVDSLLSQRSAEENEATRRIKTEFMVQLDGAGTNSEIGTRVIIVGATNRPEELDEAVRRRFVKRIYIPLPDAVSRKQLLLSLLNKVKHTVSDGDIVELVGKTDGFSGADIRSLCTEAAMGPVREVVASSSSTENSYSIDSRGLSSIDANTVPPIRVGHFIEALDTVVASVSPSDLHRYVEWNKIYGSFRRMQ